DGKMDIELSYGTNVFGKGEMETFTITGIATLTENSFNFLSNCAQGCGTGAHLAAIHVSNTPNGGSGSAWVGAEVGRDPRSGNVPEPASSALLGAGRIGLGFIRRRKD